MSVNHKSITTEGVAPCPLCGTKVQIVSDGKLCCFAPGEDLPVYSVRCRIKCPTDFLTLDLSWPGYADAENKTEQEQRYMLSEIMRYHAEQTRKIWNRRVDE